MRTTASEPAAIEAAEKAEEVARVYVRYEELKAATGCVDFGDLACNQYFFLSAMRR